MAGTRADRDISAGAFRWGMAGFAALGVLVRLAYLRAKADPTDAGEAQNVAFAIASGRGMADAYFAGSGPTAHLPPTMAAVAGGVHAWLGMQGFASAAVLEAIVLLLVFGGFALLAQAAVWFGMRRTAALGAFATLAAVPLFAKFETFWFRYWDGALALFLLALVLLALARSQDTRRRWPVAVLATVPAVLGFVLPPLGIAAVLMTGVLLLAQRQPKRLAVVAVGVALTAGAVFTPWALRNQAVMGRPILLRSNLGLELALGAGEPIASVPAFLARTIELHPFQDGPGRQAFMREGELGYFDRLRRETGAWIGAHPWEYAGLLLRHARQTIIADPFEFGIIDGSYPLPRAVLFDTVAVLGIAGFACGAWRIDRRLGLPLIVIGVMAVCYAPFQPISRYLYADYALLMFGAWLAVSLVLERSWGQGAAPGVGAQAVRARKKAAG